MISNLQKINFWYLAILIVFIPFQGLLGGIFEYRLGQSFFWLLHWYEPLLILLLLVSLVMNPKIDRSLGTSIILLLIIGFISTLLYQPFVKGIEGFRFTLTGLLFFVFSYLTVFSVNQKKLLLNIYLSVSSLIALWALIEKALPGKYWSVWGLLHPNLYWGYGWHSVGSFKQVASVLGGPNQLASFLLPSFFIALFYSFHEYQKSGKRVNVYLMLVSLLGLVIFMTFSRSASVGLISSLLLVPFFISKSIWLKRATISFAILAAAAVSFLYLSGNEIVTHGKSQTGHAEAMTQTFNEIESRYQNNQTMFFLGSGLGSAGPLAIKYGQGLVSESWYLQLLLEIGLVGVILWLFFIGFILLRLYRDKNFPVLFGLMAVSIAALFLHTWADNPALTYTFFVLLGISLNKGSIKWQEF